VCAIATERTRGRWYCTRLREHDGPCAAAPAPWYRDLAWHLHLELLNGGLTIGRSSPHGNYIRWSWLSVCYNLMRWNWGVHFERMYSSRPGGHPFPNGTTMALARLSLVLSIACVEIRFPVFVRDTDA
jgi:hypothetical protein